MEKSDVTSMRKSKSHEGGIAELLNFKQKNKDMNEFIKVPLTARTPNMVRLVSGF